MKKLLIILVLLCPTQAICEPVLILADSWLSGSGTVIYTNKEGSVILSARHVCLGNSNPYVTTVDGQHFPAEVYRLHINEDLCLIKTEAKLKPTKIATTLPVDQAFINTLFPGPVAGILTRVFLREEREYIPYHGINVAWYDGICHPGMSGSSLLNNKGEIVGVIVVMRALGTQGGYVELNYIREILMGINSVERTKQSVLTAFF